MQTLKEAAQAYEPPQYKNIAELERVSVDIDVFEEEKEGSEGKYTAHYFKVDAETYRVPKSVLSGLKVLVEEMPLLQYFKVLKTGDGMGTKYSVIPLQD